jgi:hypothetical protein
MPKLAAVVSFRSIACGAVITLLMATWWVLHKLAVIVTEYGITGGLVVCGAIYPSSLVLDRCGL